MSVLGKTPDLPVVPPPHCPHCSGELPSLGLYNWSAGAFMILSVFCPACKKILDMSVLPAVAQSPLDA